MIKRYYKQFITIIVIILCTSCKLIIIPISEEIQFTDNFDSSNKLCLPAAYTNKDGSIQGEYRINGVTYGIPSRKEKVSIHPTKGIIISGTWQSNNGFQQTVLVKNGKKREYNDSSKKIRRALCNETSDSRSLLLIQSSYPMTLSEFATELQSYCYSAVNLDTGSYGYGWYKSHIFSFWAIFNKNKQTNWIIFK